MQKVVTSSSDPADRWLMVGSVAINLNQVSHFEVESSGDTWHALVVHTSTGKVQIARGEDRAAVLRDLKSIMQSICGKNMPTDW